MLLKRIWKSKRRKLLKRNVKYWRMEVKDV